MSDPVARLNAALEGRNTNVQLVELVSMAPNPNFP
jgi:hypothetical protein